MKVIKILLDDPKPVDFISYLTGDARLEFLRNSETGEKPRSSATASQHRCAPSARTYVFITQPLYIQAALAEMGDHLSARL